jgi:hypothetical protein
MARTDASRWAPFARRGRGPLTRASERGQETEMQRRTNSILTAVAITCLGWVLQAGEAAAQTGTLRDSLVGTWEIISVQNKYDDGKTMTPFGAGVSGRYVFGRDGTFSETIIGEPRADLKTGDPRRPDAYTVINLGHFTVDEVNKSISYKIERAGYSPRNGGERTLMATVHGDTATLVTDRIKDQFGFFSFQADVRRDK